MRIAVPDRRRSDARGLPRGYLAVLALGLSVSALPACTYDPHPADGTLACSSPSGPNPSQCPQGYFCDLALGTCFAGAATGSGATGTGGTGGISGTGGAGGATAGTGGATSSGQVSGTASDYLGTWVFGLAATSDNSCSDGKNTTTFLGDKPAEMLVVATDAAGAASLAVTWLCTLELVVDSGGAHLGTAPNKCPASYPGKDPVSSIWTASRYELTVRMNDKTNATLVADYTRVDTYVDAHLVTCTQKVRAPLHKQ
jgi:hypothetical protein